MDAGAREDPAQDRGPGARLDPERFREGTGGPYDLVVEVRGVQSLAADLGGLLQDPLVGRVPGQRRAGPGLARPLDRGGPDRRLLKANRYFRERLPREPARGRTGPGPGEGGQRGVGRGVEAGGVTIGVGQQGRRRFEPGAVRRTGQLPGGPVDGERYEQGVRGGPFGPGERGDGPQEMASAPVQEEVGQPCGVRVQDLPGAVSDEVVRAARGQPAAVAFGDDEGGGGLVGERAAVQRRVREGLLARRHDHMVQAGVGRDHPGALQLVLAALCGEALCGEVVEGDGQEPFARPRAVAEHGARQPGQSRGQQRECGGGAATGEVRADAGDGRPTGRAAFGRPHAGDGPGVGRQGPGGVARGREPCAYGFDERVPYAFDRAHRVGLGGCHCERGHRLVPGDLA